MRGKLLQHVAAAVFGLLLMAGCDRGSPPPAAAVAAAKKYAGSSKSNVYHLETCRSAGQIKADNLLTFASKEEAIKAGYRACEVCKP